MSELVGSVTRKKSSDFHGGIRFQSSFTIRWELEDKTFLKINIICLDDSLQYRIKVARYSFSGPIPPKFEHKLRRHKQSFGKIATTVVLDEDGNLL